jgi:hypothetical protein
MIQMSWIFSLLSVEAAAHMLHFYLCYLTKLKVEH